ncbi:MAG: hypothetical protein AAF514_21885 [Verrucomicrobiota bacterium]
MASLPRRNFIKSCAGAASVASLPGSLLANRRPDYNGPNVVIVRFGGGVRRRETIDPKHTFSPYLCHELTKRGTLYANMVLDRIEGIETSHGQGTLFILTGKYEKHRDIGDYKEGVDKQFLGARFESSVPTVFEYLRKQYNVPDHQTLIINGEDRTDEEFYSFSNHHLFGAAFQSEVLSLYRFKVFLLRRQIASGRWDGKKLKEKQQELKKLESIDYRTTKPRASSQIVHFWENWQAHYGDSGFVNPRGDRLLTELSLRAMKELKPKLLMINYNDPDYVHWGNMSHYTRGISVIDEGLKQLITATETLDGYKDNTIFVIVPDCGRDSNPLIDIPCQHHFNSRSAHEIWALLMGPGIEKGVRIEKEVQQASVAATVGQLMQFPATFAEGPVLEEAIA